MNLMDWAMILLMCFGFFIVGWAMGQLRAQRIYRICEEMLNETQAIIARAEKRQSTASRAENNTYYANFIP